MGLNQAPVVIIFETHIFIQNNLSLILQISKLISEDAVDKLGIVRETHPTPYTLGWLNDKVNIRISQRAIVAFFVGLYYKDHIYCDVVPMDISHLMLGRP